MGKKQDQGTAVADRPMTEEVEFWCGTKGLSPFQNYGIEDVEFQKFTEKVDHKDGEMMTQRAERVGSIVKMERGKAKRILDFISKAIVTPGPPGRRRVVREERALREGENRLSDYLYLLPVDEAMSKYGASWRENPPPVE
jgi:hypothetical protein